MCNKVAATLAATLVGYKLSAAGELLLTDEMFKYPACWAGPDGVVHSWMVRKEARTSGAAAAWPFTARAQHFTKR